MKHLFAMGLAVFLSLPTLAHAQHEMHGFVSREGMAFVESEIPNFVPSTLYPPDVESSYGCVDYLLKNNEVELIVRDVAISISGAQTIRAEIDFQASGRGELDVAGWCAWDSNCSSRLLVDRARAVVEYDVRFVHGRLELDQRDLNFGIDSLDVNVAECGLVDNALNWLISRYEENLKDTVQTEVLSRLKTEVASVIESIAAGLSFSVALDSIEFVAALEGLSLHSDGIEIHASGDIHNDFRPADCVLPYVGEEPKDHDGAPPSLRDTTSHASVAVNFGMVEDALFHAWREGYMCLTDKHLQSLGVDFDLAHVASLLPGFPEGTTLRLEAILKSAPQVSPLDSQNAELKLDVRSLSIRLTGERPDGSVNELNAEIDAEAVARIGIDPAERTLKARLVNVAITRLVLDDERSATDSGFDVARIIEIAHDVVLPDILGELGDIALTGPVFAFRDYAISLASLQTTDSYLKADVNFFRKPMDDHRAPDTFLVNAPSGVMSPRFAWIQVGGSDAELPEEFLRYQVSVDGEIQAPSFMTSYRVGEVGVSKIFDVEIAAVDLSGNVDPTPLNIGLYVDGVSPHAMLAGSRRRIAEGAELHAIGWTMSDDLTETESLSPRIEIFRLEDPSDALSAKHVNTMELPKGSLEANIDGFERGGTYRVELRVKDDAGNETRSSLLIDVPSTDGCSTHSSPAKSLFFCVCILAILRRESNAPA